MLDLVRLRIVWLVRVFDQNFVYPEWRNYPFDWFLIQISVFAWLMLGIHDVSLSTSSWGSLLSIKRCFCLLQWPIKVKESINLTNENSGEQMHSLIRIPRCCPSKCAQTSSSGPHLSDMSLGGNGLKLIRSHGKYFIII